MPGDVSRGDVLPVTPWIAIRQGGSIQTYGVNLKDEAALSGAAVAFDSEMALKELAREHMALVDQFQALHDALVLIATEYAPPIYSRAHQADINRAREALGMPRVSFLR